VFIQGPTQQIAHLIHNSSYSIRTAPKHEVTSFSALTYIHTKTAYGGGSRDIANSNLGTRRGWMIEFMPWPLYPRPRTSVSCAGLCGRRIRFGRFGGEKSIAPTGIQTQDHPTRSLITIPTADGVTLNEDRLRSDQKHVNSLTPQFRPVSKRITPVQYVGPTNKDVSGRAPAAYRWEFAYRPTLERRTQWYITRSLCHCYIHNSKAEFCCFYFLC
jgi:hypothetical protein